MTKLATPSEVRTQNPTLAAALTASGFSVKQVAQEGSRLIFIFEDDANHTATLCVEAFWKQQLLFEPQKMVDAYEGIKRQIRERRAS